MEYQIFNEKAMVFQGYQDIVNPRPGDVFSMEKKVNSNSQSELVRFKIISVEGVMIVARESDPFKIN